MTSAVQPHTLSAVVSSLNQPSETEANDVVHSSNPHFDDTHGQYNTPTSTKMTANRSTYSPVPGAHDNGILYSPSSYNQHSNGMHHHQTTIISSPPPFLLSATGSPSPSASTSTYSNHYPHYTTNNSNFALASFVSQTQSPPPIPSPSSHQTMRTVYLGNLASDTQISDLLDQVRSGILESARLLPEKNCVFLTFIDAGAAAHFYHQVSHRPLTLNGTELKVGWGKPSDIPTNIRLALQNGASRNVFLGSLDDTISEEVIRQDLKRFGTIEHVRLLGEKKIAFVHFLSMADAIKCVNHLPNQVEWQNRRINYGRDRCCPNLTNITSASAMSTPSIPPSPPPPLTSYHPHYYTAHHPHPIHLQHHAYQVRYSPAFAYDPCTGTTIESYATATPPPPPPPHHHHQVHHHHHHHHQPTIPPPTAAHIILPPALGLHGDMTTPTTIYSPSYAAPGIHSTTSLAGVGNRTVYLGNIHPETTCEDICNVVRGGTLSQIRYIVDKHIAFLVFVDPAQALQFYTHTSDHGMVLKGRRLKLGWGKPSSLSGTVLQAVHNGGSRNVYLGNLDNTNHDDGDEGDGSGGGNATTAAAMTTVTMNEEKLKHDFSEYGEIELVNTLKEKNCAFINFTSIAAAVRAIEGIRGKEEYKRFRINYGKDRCGNPPRSPSATAALQKSSSSSLPEQPLVEAIIASSSSSSSTTTTTATTNSATTPPPPPPTISSKITTTAAPATLTTTANHDNLLPLVDDGATTTLVNGLEIMPTTFPSSNNSYNMAPLTDLMTDGALN